MLREKGVVECIRKLLVFVTDMVLVRSLSDVINAQFDHPIAIFDFTFQSSPMPPRPVDGVRAEEVIETSVACIYNMAKDPGNHPLFRADAELVRVLTR